MNKAGETEQEQVDRREIAEKGENQNQDYSFDAEDIADCMDSVDAADISDQE